MKEAREVKDIMDTLFDEVSQEKPFYINIKKRTIKVNKKYLIKEGVIQNGYTINLSNRDPYEVIQVNYEIFKTSRPDRNCKRSYFKAKSSDELTDKEFVIGESRSLAQAILEGYIVCAIVTNKMYWKNPKHWYWVSPRDKDLILLREWVLGY